MHVGRRSVCSVCGGVPFDDGRPWLDVVSGLLIGIATCLRCGAGFIYALRAAPPTEEDDDEG